MTPNKHRHEKHSQSNSEENNNILRVQHDKNQQSETVIKEIKVQNKNSIKKNKINLKIDIQEIKEAFKEQLKKH